MPSSQIVPTAVPPVDAAAPARAAVFRTRLAAETRRILLHRAFPSARTLFCREVAGFWQASRVHRDLIADTGGIGFVISLTGMARLGHTGAVPVQKLVDALAAAGIASPTRSRMLIRLLTAHGAIEALPDGLDGRRRLLRPAPLLSSLNRDWLAANLAATALVSELPLPPRALADVPGLAEAYLADVMLRHVRENFTVFTDYPEVAAFMDHRGGYMLMLALAGSDSGFNRSALARAAGVSRAHLLALLASAEQRGWVQRRPGQALALAEDFAAQMNGWIARELALFTLHVEDRAGLLAVQN